MKSFIGGLTAGLLVFYLIFKFKEPQDSSKIDSQGLIEQQIENVSELVVLEGHFSDILTYKDVKKFYVDWLSAEKKAVVLVKAKATVSYNLKNLEYYFDDKSNTIVITHIPNSELNIYPSLEYYNLEQGYLNPFSANDYNKIDHQVKEKLEKQIANSAFQKNSENRLISELFYLISKGFNKPFRIIIEDSDNTLEKLIE